MDSSRIEVRLMIFFITLILFICAVGGVIAFVVWASNNSDSEDAIDLNSGRGSRDNPIPAGAPVEFETFSVTPLYYVRPADDLVRSFFLTNEVLVDNEQDDLVLVRYRLRCKQGQCEGDDFQTRLVDGAGSEWDRPQFMRVQDNFRGMETAADGQVEGWELYAMPPSSSLSMVKIIFRETTLYVQAPPIQAR